MRIITIGREFGSGGRELGRRAAEELGIAYYDQEIIQEIAGRTELSESYVRNIVEHKPVISFPIHVARSLQPMSDPMVELSQSIFKEQVRIIHEMAQRSDCVIVGRCADYILRAERPLRVFVYADIESKMARCRAKEPEDDRVSDKEMKRRMADVDKNRAKYYNFFTGQRWGDRSNYDLCVNTTLCDIKELAAALARLAG